MSNLPIKKGSKQRTAIINVLQSTTSHPTADWIYTEVRKIIPNISLGTVYRNLSALAEENEILSEEERLKGVQKALRLIPERVEYFAEMMNVTYGRITIREQKTRWGSCSSKGNLNFNWKLVLMPEEVLDYVVVHELAHRKEMNHSERFWNHVEKVLPDYQARRKLLRELEHRHL